MITQESLRKEVVQYLNTNYSIKIQLPVFQRHLGDRISLKFFRSSLGENLTENRYLMLVKQSEDLLKKNIINTEKIKVFAEQFFETITNDIQVLQGNEEIRKGFTRMRDQITYRVEELASQQKQIEAECKAINQKQQILTFLESRFKNYLNKVKIVSEYYQSVNSVQVLTSLNLDAIYSQRMAQEQDYVQHFQPLLEVMQRLKTNMIKLYQQLNRCQYFQLPLRSVNFLANCKNLLMELQPFIIRPDCVFNRLIFHVTKGQKDNIQLIGRVFQANSAFANDVVSDIFKAFFMAHIFKDYYRSISERILTQRQELINQFQNPRTNSDNFYGQISKLQKKLREIKLQIDSLKKVIGMGKDKIMRQYLGRKQCKKLGSLIALEEKAKGVVKFSKTMLSVLRFKSRLIFLEQSFRDIERNSLQTIKAIKQQQKQNLKIEKPVTPNIKQIDEQIQKKFKDSYLKIQEGILQIAQTKQVMKQTKDDNLEPYFLNNFFPKIQSKCQEIMKKYVQSEIELLNHYQSLRKQKIVKGEEAMERSKQLLIQLSDYFDGKLEGDIGYEIRNQDAECEQVKDNIIKVEQVEFLLNNFIGNKSNDLKELTRFKYNLQWLLQVFQGSMDQKIFESFMEKLNFQAQDWMQRVKKVKQLLRQTNRYLSTLKNIIKICVSDIFPKVLKLIKNRVQLYEVIQDMYEEFITVYDNTLQNQQMSPKDYGIKLFDQKDYKYVMTLYQYRNRLRAQMSELKDLLLPKRTLNYLLDDIYEPFVQIFSNYVAYTEEELLNFTLSLEQALNFKSSQKDIIMLFQQTLSKPYNQSYFQNVNRICEQLVRLNNDNKKVISLQHEDVVVYNLNEFKNIFNDIQQHVLLAQSILQGVQSKDMNLELDLTNETLKKLASKVSQEWQNHKEEIKQSLSVSRAEDF